MAEMDAQRFRAMPPAERAPLLAWLARHRYDPNIVETVLYEPGALVCEVVVYLHRDGMPYFDPTTRELARRTDVVECPGDAPPID